MKRIKKVILVLILFNNLCYGFFDWEVLKTDKVTLFYKNKFEKRALKLLSSIEYLSVIPENILDNKVSSLAVVLEDYGLYTNGFANPVYINIHIINNESGDKDWLSLAWVHEYTHILHLTKADGLPGFFKNIIGNIICPQIFSPLWIYEGITVYNESKIDKYMGRLNDGGYDAYLAVSVSEDKFPTILKATYMPSEAPFGNGPYIFGSQFVKFLSEKYGEEKLKSFYDSYGKSLLSYFSPLFPWLGIDRTFLEIYGKTTEDLWMLWKTNEKEKYLNYNQPGEKITDFKTYVSYPAIYNDVLYFAKINYDKNGAYSIKTRQDIMVMDLEKDKIELLFSTTSKINHPLRFFNDKIYYSIEEIEPGFENRSNFSYGIISVITERDLKTGNEKEIIKGEIKTFDLLKGKLIYVKDKKYEDGSELYEYDMQTKENKLIAEFENNIFLINSFNQNLYCVAKKDKENKGIYKIDLENKKMDIVIDTSYIEDGISIIDDKIFFQSNYEKIYSLYCYEIKNKKVFRITDSGLAGSPAFDSKRNNLYFIGLNSDGFDVYKLKPVFNEFTFKKEKEKVKVNYYMDKEKIKKGSYLDNLLTLAPKIRIPIAYMDSQNYFKTGFLIDSMDAIGDFGYTFLFLYDFKESITYQDLKFNSYILSPLTMNFSYSNFNNKRKDVFGLGIDYTVYASYKPGVSYILTSIENYFYENFTKQRVMPGIKAVLNYPSLNIGIATSFIFENEKQILYEKTKEGYYGRVIFSYFLPETKITFLTDGFYGLNKNIDNEIQIRGYGETIKGKQGILFTNEISRNIFKIRSGLWNPVNIYFEDLSGVVFWDYALNENTNYYSGGIELHTEMKLLFFVNMDLGVYFSVNRQNEKSCGIILKSPQISF